MYDLKLKVSSSVSLWLAILILHFFYSCYLVATRFSMAQLSPLIMRILSASIPVANHAGKIIRDVLKKGELNIVDKVNKSG